MLSKCRKPGDKEAESGLVTVRKRQEGDIGSMTLDDFIDTLTEEIRERR